MPCRVLDRRGHGPYRAVGTRRIRLAEARTRPTGAAFSGTVLRIVSGTPLPCMAVPGGTFLMGSPASEKNSDDTERPQHRVTVAPFWMGKYPVTQAEWNEVCRMGGLDPKQLIG